MLGLLGFLKMLWLPGLLLFFQLRLLGSLGLLGLLGFLRMLWLPGLLMILGHLVIFSRVGVIKVTRVI